jgi:hypothetical protein
MEQAALEAVNKRIFKKDESEWSYPQSNTLEASANWLENVGY